MVDPVPGFATDQFRLAGRRCLITGGRGALAEEISNSRNLIPYLGARARLVMSIN